jgi:hypothetical protein
VAISKLSLSISAFHPSRILACSSMIASYQPPHPHTTDDIPIFRLLTHASPSEGVISTHHSPPTLILTFSTVFGLTDESRGSFDSHSAFVTSELNWEARRSRDWICDVRE